MNWRRIGISLVFILPIIALLSFGMTLNPRELPSTMPGKAAPEFALDVIQYAEAPPAPAKVSLSEHRGDVVVLNFWASWCLACRDEHRELSSAALRYRGEGVHFYGVLYNDAPQNGVDWIRQMGGQVYPALHDPGARTAIDYGLYGVPETFIIGPDGQVAYKHIGPVTEEVLVEWIEKLKSGPVETAG